MSIDFSTLKGLTIPEGVVTQIADASGRVLWSAVKPMVTVTLLSDTFENRNYTSAYIEYITPDGDTGYLNTAGTYELPIGTSITCFLEFRGKDGASLSIFLNDDGVAYSYFEAKYEYTLTRNIAIDLWNGYYNGGSIYITEIP